MITHRRNPTRAGHPSRRPASRSSGRPTPYPLAPVLAPGLADSVSVPRQVRGPFGVPFPLGRREHYVRPRPWSNRGRTPLHSQVPHRPRHRPEPPPTCARGQGRRTREATRRADPVHRTPSQRIQHRPRTRPDGPGPQRIPPDVPAPHYAVSSGSTRTSTLTACDLSGCVIAVDRCRVPLSGAGASRICELPGADPPIKPNSADFCLRACRVGPRTIFSALTAESAVRKRPAAWTRCRRNTAGRRRQGRRGHPTRCWRIRAPSLRGTFTIILGRRFHSSCRPSRSLHEVERMIAMCKEQLLPGNRGVRASPIGVSSSSSPTTCARIRTRHSDAGGPPSRPR